MDSREGLLKIKEIKKDLYLYREIYKRAKKRISTQDDNNKLSNCSTSCVNNVEAAIWYIEKFKKQIRKIENGLIEEGYIFDFPETCSVIPNIMLRGKLFKPTQKKDIAWIDICEIAKWGNISLSYKGKKLTQYDLDVLLCLIQILKENQFQGSVEKITFENGETAYTRIKYSRRKLLLKGMKKNSAYTSDYKRLSESMYRLKAGEFKMRKENKRLIFSILGDYGDVESGISFVDINESFIKTLKFDNYSIVNLERRMMLKKDTSKWLQGFISSHNNNSTPYSSEKFQTLMGSEYKRPRDYIKKTLIPAFEDLIKVGDIVSYKKIGHLFKWNIITK